jgi:hypothetical protein
MLQAACPNANINMPLEKRQSTLFALMSFELVLITFKGAVAAAPTTPVATTPIAQTTTPDTPNTPAPPVSSQTAAVSVSTSVVVVVCYF